MEYERKYIGLEEKIDKLIDELGNIRVNIAELKGATVSIERGLIAEIKNHDNRINTLEKAHDKRIEKLEANQRWVAISIVGYVILRLLELISGL